MHTEATLLTHLAVSLILALLLGIGAHRIGLPVILGYLLAGFLVGPNTAWPSSCKGQSLPVRLQNQKSHPAVSRQGLEAGRALERGGEMLSWRFDDHLQTQGFMEPISGRFMNRLRRQPDS